MHGLDQLLAHEHKIDMMQVASRTGFIISSSISRDDILTNFHVLCNSLSYALFTF